jgi:hypothetical protein
MPFERSFQLPKSVVTAVHEVARQVTTDKVRAYPKFKRTLHGLILTFRKLFPRSDFRLRVLKSTKKEFGLHVLFKGVVEAADHVHSYHVSIQLHKEMLTDKFSVMDKAEVKCTCEAFRYWNAFADLRSKNLYANPTNWNRVPAKIRNPKSIPGCCKHLIAYANQLLINNEIKRSK